MGNAPLLGALLAAVAVYTAYRLGYRSGFADGRDAGFQDGKKEGTKLGSMRGYAIGFDRGKRARPEPEEEAEDEEPAPLASGSWRTGLLVLLVAMAAVFWLASRAPLSPQGSSTGSAAKGVDTSSPRPEAVLQPYLLRRHRAVSRVQGQASAGNEHPVRGSRRPIGRANGGVGETSGDPRRAEMHRYAQRLPQLFP